MSLAINYLFTSKYPGFILITVIYFLCTTGNIITCLVKMYFLLHSVLMICLHIKEPDISRQFISTKSSEIINLAKLLNSLHHSFQSKDFYCPHLFHKTFENPRDL